MNILSKFQLPISSGLELRVLWIYFHKPWLSYQINYEAVCRTAPATPGLLKNFIQPSTYQVMFYLNLLLLWCYSPTFCLQFLTLLEVVKNHKFWYFLNIVLSLLDSFKTRQQKFYIFYNIYFSTDIIKIKTAPKTHLFCFACQTFNIYQKIM